MPNKLSISRSSLDFLDTFQVVFLNATQNTLLPEVMEVFGAEMAMKFLDTFAGTTITVPSRKRFTDCVRDTDVYMTLSASDGQNEDLVIRLASKYDLDRESVLAIHKRIRAVVGRMDASNGR